MSGYRVFNQSIKNRATTQTAVRTLVVYLRETYGVTREQVETYISNGGGRLAYGLTKTGLSLLLTALIDSRWGASNFLEDSLTTALNAPARVRQTA